MKNATARRFLANRNALSAASVAVPPTYAIIAIVKSGRGNDGER